MLTLAATGNATILVINLKYFPEINSVVFTSINAVHFRFNLDK
jgi:hypothetical protein